MLTLPVMRTPEDIRTLFQRYYKPLCLYALHYLQDAAAAEDAVQESFTAYWQKCAGAPAGTVATPKAYLYTAVRNRCIDRLRRTGPQTDHLQPEEVAGLIADEEAQERSEREARLWEAVERLPRQRRELLLMSKRDGMSYEQIAETAGLSPNTVRNQISRALHTLRAALSPGSGMDDLLLLLAAFPVA